jgi:hypothetical protein
MNTAETATVLEALKFAYPRFYNDMTPQETDGTIKLWAMMFENDNLQIVIEAVKAMITTLKFPPTIADIKEKIHLLKAPKTGVLTEMEAWGLVYRAICNSSYDSEKRFNELPEVIQRLVGTPKQLREWATTENLNVSVIQSNFMRSYKVMAERKEMIDRLPDSCKNLLNEEDKLCLSVNNATELVLFPM